MKSENSDTRNATSDPESCEALRQRIAELELQLEQAQASAGQQLRFLEAMLAAIPTPIYFKDTQGRYIGCNDAYTEQLGLTHTGILGKTVFDVWPEDLANLYQTMDSELLRNPGRQLYESRVRNRDGHLRDVVNVRGVFYDAEGKPAGIVGAFLDITERKQVEAELRASEARHQQTSLMLESLFNAIPDILGIQDTRHGIIRYNRAGYDFVRRSPDEVQGFCCFELIGRSEPCEICATREVYETLKPARVERHFPELGIWLDVRAYPVLDESGELLMVIEHLRDITDRKAAGRALHESEQRYRLLAENSTDVIWTMDMNLQSTYTSPAVRVLRGYESDEAMAQPLSAALTPASIALAAATLREELASEGLPGVDPSRSRTMDFEILRKDGSTVWVESKVTFLRDESGTPVGILGVSRDIQARREAEEALRESEQRYRLLAENTTDVIWSVDMDLNFTYISPSVKRLRGYEVHEALIQPLDTVLTPDSLQLAASAFREALGKEFSSDADPSRSRALELEVTRKNGSTAWTETTITFLRDASGSPVEMLGVSRDITARREAEKALRQSERRHRLLAENSTDVIWTANLDLHFTYISPAIARLRGYSAEETMAQSPWHILTRQSAEIARQALRESMALQDDPDRTHGGSRTLELELQCRDGSTVWTETTFTFLRDDIGDAVEILGVTRNITERKQAEDARQRRLAYERLLSRLAAMAVNIDTLHAFIEKSLAAMGEVLAASHAFILQHHQESPNEEKPAITVFTWRAPNALAYAQNLPAFVIQDALCRARALRDGESLRVSDLEALPDAKLRDSLRAQHVHSLWATPLYVRGEFFGILGFDDCERQREWPEEDTGLMIAMSRVISNAVERKQAEEALRASEARYRSLIEQSSDAIYLLSDDRFELVNPRFEALFGFTAEEVTAPDFDFMSLVAPQCRELVAERGRRIAAGEDVSAHYEFTALTRSGDEIEVEVSVSYIGYRDIVATQGILRDISARKRAEKAQQQQLQRIQRQQAAVVALSLHPAFINGNITAASQFLTETVAATLGPARAVSVWLLSEDGAQLHCHDLFSCSEGLHRSGQIVTVADYPNYFLALRQGRVIDAQNARTDTRTCEFADSYFRTVGTSSVLDATLRLAGEIAGVISVEHEGELREWHPDEITFAGAVADQLVQALVNARRMQAEKQLRESEARFRALAENIPGAVYLMGPDGVMLYLNQAVEIVTGYPRTDFLGHALDLAEFTHPDDVGAKSSAIRDALAARRPFHLLYRLRHADGSWRWVEEWGGGIYDGDDLVFIEGFLADITDRRTLETQLRRQEQLAAIGQLAAGIAHDFRNLLTTIILYAHLGQRQHETPPAVIRHLSIIAGEANKATDLVEQILDFSRRTELDRQPLDLVAFLGSIITVLQRTLPENIHIAFDVGPGSHVIEGDAGRLQQALTNLALNARDAMPQGGNLRISLVRIPARPGIAPPLPAMAEVLAPPAWICLTVADTGEGMSPEVQARLFQPFFTTKEEGKGTGLGLAQVYGIIQLHAGYIDVSTAENQGATFRIYLPAAAGLTESAIAGAPSIPMGRGETLLLVEDNSHLREASQTMLSDLGYRVLSAANGREALTVVQDEHAIDLLITDLVMPEIGGKTLLRTLREQYPSLKALVMTGHTTVENVETLRAAGFLEVIRKPFDVDTLAGAVRRALDERIA